MTPIQSKLIVRAFHTEASRKAQSVHGPGCKICRKAAKGARRAHRKGVRLLAQAFGVGKYEGTLRYPRDNNGKYWIGFPIFLGR
jgi:hypothetical protein